MKPIIGISGSVIIDDSGIFPGYRRSYVNEDYVDSVIQNGGIPYIIPFNENEEVIKEQLLNVQGLILSGGHDVDPHKRGPCFRNLSWSANNKCVSRGNVIPRLKL